MVLTVDALPIVDQMNHHCGTVEKYFMDFLHSANAAAVSLDSRAVRHYTLIELVLPLTM